MHYVYILKGDRHYIGYTSDLEKRLERHRDGYCETTKRLHIFELVGYFVKETKSEAMKLEKMIKKNGHIEHWIQHDTFVKINKKLN